MSSKRCRPNDVFPYKPVGVEGVEVLGVLVLELYLVEVPGRPAARVVMPHSELDGSADVWGAGGVGWEVLQVFQVYSVAQEQQ